MSAGIMMLAHRLLELEVSADGTEVWRDVPEHFGRFYPATLEMPSNRVTASEGGGWFAQQLEQILRAPPITYKIDVRAPGSPRSTCLVANCLDPVYGHALYKLAAARALTTTHPGLDIWVIVSRALAENAEFSDGAIIVDEGLGIFSKPSSNLLPAIREATKNYAVRHWAFGNGARIGAQAILPLPPGTEPSAVRNRVLFLHRSDRCWGLGARHQAWNVNRVFARLRRQAALEMCVIGVGTPTSAYDCDEVLISARPDSAYEKTVMDWSSQAACVLAVHGSHLLVPSYLAAAVVELLPLNRIGNSVQAYWPHPDRPAIDVLFSHRVLYGDRFLLTVTPGMVGAVMSHLIAQREARQSRYNADIILAPM